MVVPKDILPQGIYYPSLKKGKTDYFYDGLEYLEEDDFNKALNCFKMALKIDEKYVDGYNGLGNVYSSIGDKEESKKYYRQAYLLTKEHFKGIWPEKLEWGILENRQYLRAIRDFGLCFWEENNVQEAKNLFMLLLKLNPRDNQGIRYLVACIFAGISFDEFGKMEDKAIEKNNYDEMENLLNKQNKIHNFWVYES